MKLDVIDIHHSLNIKEFMKLDLDATNDAGKQVTFINPSVSKAFIYFRTIFDKDIWISNICMYNKEHNDFNIVPTDESLNNIEDLRIFDYDNKVWFVGYRRNPETTLFETHIGYFNSDCTSIDGYIGKIATDGHHVKNITQLVEADTQNLWFIDIYTATVYSYNTTSQTISKSHKLDTTLLDERMNTYTNAIFGTTQYMHIEGSLYGSLVHITKFIGSKVYYVYLWIEIDIQTWQVTFVSAPFVIHELGLVFVSCIEKCNDGNIQLMFGYHDDHTCRCTTTLDDLRISCKTKNET